MKSGIKERNCQRKIIVRIWRGLSIWFNFETFLFLFGSEPPSESFQSFRSCPTTSKSILKYEWKWLSSIPKHRLHFVSWWQAWNCLQLQTGGSPHKRLEFCCCSMATITQTISLIKDNFIIVCYLIVASRLSALAFIQLHNCFNKWRTMSLLSRAEPEKWIRNYCWTESLWNCPECTVR